MIRARAISMKRFSLRQGMALAAAMLGGALLALLIAARPADAVPTQDPAVQMQIQQALSNFQLQLQTQLNLMQSTIDNLEREQQRMRLELDRAARDRARSTTPLPIDPIPGTATYGRLVSESSEAYRFELHAPTGELLGQLGPTADGPALVLFDAEGRISAALMATPDGPELRMRDADGVLQTVLSGY